jgi:two-component system response regulator FixJ
MKSGAVDFIEKPYSDDALIAAIESALKGGVRKDRTGDMTAAAALIDTLSPRERQVLEALVAGQPNKVIAFDLGISVRTVEVHRARMMERLGVRQFAEAVRLSVLATLAEGG